jgi:hypothetical protein
MMEQFGIEYSDSETCDEYVEDEDCMYISEDMDWCTASVTYDSCSWEELDCYVEFSMDNENYNGACEDFESWFDYSFSEYDDCDVIVEEGDCLEEFSEQAESLGLNLQYCSFNSTYDDCTGSEIWCNATVMVDNTWYNDTCDFLEIMFEMESDWESDCIVYEVEDCMADMMEIEGIEYCMYSAEYDECTGEDYGCNAEVMVSGQWFNDTCDAVMEMFGVSEEDFYSDEEWYSDREDSYTDECIHETETSCGLEDFLEHCVIFAGYDACADEEICNVEWFVDGFYDYDNCDNFWAW